MSPTCWQNLIKRIQQPNLSLATAKKNVLQMITQLNVLMCKTNVKSETS